MGENSQRGVVVVFIRVFFPTRLLLTVFVDNEPGSV